MARLEVMVSLANSNMQLTSIRQQIASAVHLLVQASRLSDGSRRVVSLTEVTGMEGEVVTLQDLFVFEKRGLDPDGKVVGRFAATGIRPKFYEKLLSAGIRLRAGPVRRSGGGLKQMSFILLILLVWGVAMGAWFLVSKYAKSSDIDKVKARLSGTTKAKAKKNAKDAAAAGASVVRQEVVSKNRFAQMLVDKWGWVPSSPHFWSRPGSTGRRRAWYTFP